MKIKQVFANTGLMVKKNSPAILTGLGIVGMGVTTYLTIKHAPTVENIILRTKEDKEAGLEVNRKEVALELGKELALPVASGLLTISCFLWSYRIQAARVSALSGAFTALSSEMNEVRERYRVEHGDKAYNEFFSPATQVDVTKIDSKGKEKTEKESEKNPHLGLTNGVWFDKSAEYTSDDHEYNMAWVESQISKLELNMFQKGHMLMNEVLETLGFDRVRMGALLGWHVVAGFQVKVFHIWNEEKQIREPQIYISWDTPQYIYEDVEFNGRYATYGI